MPIQGRGTAVQESCPSQGRGSDLWRFTCPALSTGTELGASCHLSLQTPSEMEDIPILQVKMTKRPNGR